MHNLTDVHRLRQSLSKIHPFSEEQLCLFTGKCIQRKIKKKEFLIRENEPSDRLTYIQTGSFRFFKKLKHGEMTMKFFIENEWMADLESLLTQQPSTNYIEAIEDSQVISISLVEIHRLMDHHPVFRMLNVLLADLTIPSSYLATINSKSPDERYRELMLTHPQWINRFPQMLIASYLGMTPETLSRVKARFR